MADGFVEVVVAHHHWCCAAAGKTFDELDRELSVLRRLQAVRVRIKTQLLAKMFVQRMRTTQRATQRAANFDLIFADGLLPEHRVERDEFVDVDGLQIELLRRPLDRFL